MPALRTFALAAIASAAGWTPAHAQWEGQGQAGLVMARGNSTAESANVRLDLKVETKDWKHTLLASGLYGRNNTFQSAGRWEARGQTDYKLSDRLSIFGAMRYQEDKFSGFDYQATTTAGVGCELIDTAKVRLSGTLGAGYRELRPEQLVRDTDGNVLQRIESTTNQDPVANAALSYAHKLFDTTSLTAKLLMETGPRNTYTQNDVALQVAMTEKTALSLGYGIRHNSGPPEGLEKTDQLTTVNLVYRLR